MTYSPEQAALLAAFSTIITAFLSYLFNVLKTKSEHLLKKDEAVDKNRDSTIQSFRNELGLNPGLVKEIFSRDAQLVAQNGKIVKLLVRD